MMISILIDTSILMAIIVVIAMSIAVAVIFRPVGVYMPTAAGPLAERMLVLRLAGHQSPTAGYGWPVVAG